MACSLKKALSKYGHALHGVHLSLNSLPSKDFSVLIVAGCCNFTPKSDLEPSFFKQFAKCEMESDFLARLQLQLFAIFVKLYRSSKPSC